MKNWTKHTILKAGFPMTVYVNQTATQAYVFPLFGRCYSLHSDSNVLDFATDFLLGIGTGNVVSFSAYQGSFEDTAVIQIDKAA